MFIFSNWKINRKEENTQRKPFKQNEDQKGSIFEFTKGLNFPKENEMFNFQNSMKQKIIWKNLSIWRG